MQNVLLMSLILLTVNFSENSCGPNKDEDLIRSYNDLIEVHREHTKLLDDQLNQARNEDDDVKIVTAEDVLNLVQELYQLKNSGEFIRECYEKQQRVRGRIALLYTERNVDGSPEDVPNGVISNRVLITIVISIVILGYCISRCLRR